MPKTYSITVAELEALEACEDQVKLFKKTFGTKVTFSSKRELLKLIKDNPEFDYEWAASEMLKGPAYKAYLDIKVPAYKAYRDIHGPAFGEAYWAQITTKN